MYESACGSLEFYNPSISPHSIVYFIHLRAFCYFATMQNEILDILKQHKLDFFSKYPLQSMALFGSFSRGDNNDNSDVDILVELNGAMGFRFLHLNYEIESLLRRKVDLISKRALKQEFLKEIESELIYI